MARTVSVVIPCFNAAPYVVAAVQSALTQQAADVEVIVVDDGSSDGSADRVAAQCPSARVLRQPNAGVAAARNRGMQAATGEWIAFLDADDIWLPGKLDAQLSALEQQPDAQMAYTAWYVWPSTIPEPSAEDIEALQRAGTDHPDTGPTGWIYGPLLLDCEVWTSTVIGRRSLFQQIGYFDASLRIGEDYDLWLRASRVTPILRVPKKLALYRMHTASITRSAPAQNWRALVVSRAVEQWGYQCPHGSRANSRDVARVLARSWRHHAEAHLARGATATARSASLAAVRGDPGSLQSWKVLAKCWFATATAAAEPA
jgi:glycosyltransferase involved in cell wall biosynthesis